MPVPPSRDRPLERILGVPSPEVPSRPDADIGWHEGPRDALRALFALAEDSRQRLDASIGQGRILVAADAGDVAGVAQLVAGTAGEVELRTLAVAEDRQRRGLGRALVRRAVAECRRDGAAALLVATAAADTGVLRFYQRLGFRLLRVERDAFPATDGYPAGLAVDGVPVRDRVWLSLDLRAGAPRSPEA